MRALLERAQGQASFKETSGCHMDEVIHMNGMNRREKYACPLEQDDESF